MSVTDPVEVPPPDEPEPEDPEEPDPEELDEPEEPDELEELPDELEVEEAGAEAAGELLAVLEEGPFPLQAARNTTRPSTPSTALVDEKTRPIKHSPLSLADALVQARAKAGSA